MQLIIPRCLHRSTGEHRQEQSDEAPAHKNGAGYPGRDPKATVHVEYAIEKDEKGQFGEDDGRQV